MEKKYLVFIVTASLVFAVGLGGGLMISRQGSIDYSKDWKFESAGFRMPLGKEITGRIKEIKSDSLVLSFAEAAARDPRTKKTVDKEIIVNEQTSVWLKKMKGNEEIYGAETWQKITSLDEKRKKISPRGAREGYADLSKQIADLKRAAIDAQFAKTKELSEQMAALKPEDSAKREELNQQLIAMGAKYTLTAIKLSDLQVGETATLSNEKEIDLNGEVVAERIVITR